MTTGVDDFLNQWETGNYPGGRSFNVGTDVFFGGGVYFTDEDMKTLIGAGIGSTAPPPRRRSGAPSEAGATPRGASAAGTHPRAMRHGTSRTSHASPAAVPKDRPDRERPVGRLEVHLVTRRVPDAAELGESAGGHVILPVERLEEVYVPSGAHWLYGGSAAAGSGRAHRTPRPAGKAAAQ